MKEKELSEMKQKKNKKYLLFLTMFFIAYYILITRFGKNLYGSMLDWNCQHYLIPDYFRKLFYTNKNIFPSFAFNLGAGQNIYNFSYYGLLNPIILISYLLPFISMRSYIQISSIVLAYVSVILFYKWIEKKFDSKISLVSTLVFMLATPLLFHTHRHIMFINYMPFLILGLIGVDNYFTKRKKWLLMLSVFLVCSTSYFFSIGSIITLIIYGIYIYIKLNKKIIFKNFIKDGFKFLYSIIIGILSSMMVLLPTFLAILNGRGESSVSIDYLSLFIPRINTNYVLYYTYSVGLTSVVLFALIYLIVNMKKEKRFLAISLSLLIIFPIFIFILNAGMYLNAKVLIPFTPLYVLTIALMLDSLIKSKSKSLISLIIFFVLCIITFIFWGRDYLFLVDFLIVSLSLVLFYKFQKEKIIITTIIFISFIAFIVNSFSDNLVKSDYSYDYESTSHFIELLDKNDKSFYRISNRNGGLGTANDVVDISLYKSSIYSSVSNQDYQNFYYNLIGNNILNRSKGQLSEPRNLLFNIYMNNKYLITDEHVDELGYNLIKEESGNYLYQNNDVLSLGYSSSRIMSKSDYDKLSYPYNVEALLNYIIVDDEVISSEYKTNVEKLNLNYSVLDTNNITIEDKKDYIEINFQKDGNIILELDKNIENKLLLIKFELLDSNSCNIGDSSISINNVYNKLTCKGWKYNNKNYMFEYTISDKNIARLNIKFDKGNYKIKNIETYIIDYEKLVSSYKNVSDFNIDISKTKADVIDGNIKAIEDGYFNLSVPYDKGFAIYVDGKRIDYEKTDLSFIGFKINKGNHHIKIVYTSPGLNVSKSISIFGILVFLSTLYIEEAFYKKHIKKISK